MDKMRFNDGKAAPGGAVIIGRMHADWRKGAPGRLYKWGPLSSLVVSWGPLPARVLHTCQKGSFWLSAQQLGRCMAALSICWLHDRKMRRHCVILCARADLAMHGTQLCRIDLRTKQWEEILSPDEVGLPNGMAWDVKKQVRL